MFLINLTGKIVIISFYIKLYLHNILKLCKIIILNTIFHHLNVFFLYTPRTFILFLVHMYSKSLLYKYVFEKLVVTFVDLY